MRTHTLEVWRAIRGYEGLYEVSNWARVRSVERYVESRNRWGKCVRHYKEKILSQTPNSEGYLTVQLRKNGVYEHKYIHQLVAQAFIPNPFNYTEVHHIDHNQLNNNVSNLEWISKDKHHALHGAEQAKTVYQYTLDGLLVNVWESVHEVERQLGFSQSAIRACCNGGRYDRKKWINVTQSNGFGWSYSPLEQIKKSKT